MIEIMSLLGAIFILSNFCLLIYKAVDYFMQGLIEEATILILIFLLSILIMFKF